MVYIALISVLICKPSNQKVLLFSLVGIQPKVTHAHKQAFPVMSKQLHDKKTKHFNGI